MKVVVNTYYTWYLTNDTQAKNLISVLLFHCHCPSAYEKLKIENGEMNVQGDSEKKGLASITNAKFIVRSFTNG